MVFSEFEKNANAILVHFGVQDQTLMDIFYWCCRAIAVSTFTNAG